MTQEYLEQLKSLTGHLTAGGFKGIGLECKHFFSGAAVYAGGRMCMSWTPAGFAIKLPGAARIALIWQGAGYLRYFPKGPVKKDYVVLPNSMLSETKVLRNLVRTSVEYVLSLPAPLKRTKANGRSRGGAHDK